LPLEVYNKLKQEPYHSSWNRSGRYFKEDRTCIFSTEFALRLMGDVQEYFITKNVRNFIRFLFQDIILKQGANQLRNWLYTFKWFHYVNIESWMNINDFGPNLSFFFSMVLIQNMQYGRVARKIWAKAMKKIWC
jgi:methylmalonyl-CoA mutase